ncbi:glutathione S-transferase family protein [Azospirillum sp. TSO35-2]|uniref:glutathione S-transferase family protein n=1 Tax=Azospirillum sp. TSO35-2 TaxID=716796 RepID=UPI000D614BE8|nr:glutathione S-transferase family protein [Azospirillum sp. TSO35-2]PWC33397.1 glutathione S-transferase [Azospirillum sp. TSO35-2]
MTAPFILHGNVNSQPATRIALFFRLAGIPFQYRHVDLRSGQQKTPEYQAINRFGRVPTLVHGDRSVSESSVILTYLAQQTGKFGGRDEDETIRIAEWLSWLADVLLPVQRARAVRKFNGDANALPWIDASAVSGMRLFDQHLAGRQFIEGDRLTIADIFAFPWIDLMNESAIEAADYPNVQAWADRIRALPGYQPQYDLMPSADAAC